MGLEQSRTSCVSSNESINFSARDKLIICATNYGEIKYSRISIALGNANSIAESYIPLQPTAKCVVAPGKTQPPS